MSAACCDIVEKFGGEQAEVFRNGHWIVQVRPKQVTLGSCVLIARRHAESLAGLAPDELAAFGSAVDDLERRLRAAFAFDKINYLLLMMVDRHLHFHVLPRYATARRFAGMEWPDAAWPKAPVLDSAVPAGAALETIVAALREAR